MGCRRTFNATDIGIDLDRIAARKPAREWIFLDGVEPWEHAQHEAARLGFRDCPVCGDADLASSRYCSACDRAGLDDITTYPGLPVGSGMDPSYVAEYPAAAPPSYRPDPVLRGGLGGRIKSRKQRRAERRAG